MNIISLDVVIMFLRRRWRETKDELSQMPDCCRRGKVLEDLMSNIDEALHALTDDKIIKAFQKIAVNKLHEQLTDEDDSDIRYLTTWDDLESSLDADDSRRVKLHSIYDAYMSRFIEAAINEYVPELGGEIYVSACSAL